jgi:hypothetical protein
MHALRGKEILEFKTLCQHLNAFRPLKCLDRKERVFSFNSKNATQGVGAMEDKEKKESEEETKKPKGKPLPFCTNAPSPEHTRSDSEDEPCDDSREGR